jgi:hypothetical protein
MGQRIVRLEKGGSITPRQVRQAYGKKIVSPRTGNLIKTPYVKARMVKHPGNRAYKFMERGLEIALKKLKQRL